MNLHELKNEIENLSENARLALTRDLLEDAAKKENSKIRPLDYNFSLRKEEKTEEEKTADIIGLAALAVTAVVTGVLTFMAIRQDVKEAKAAEEARLEEEKKAIIRKMSSIKGRV